VWISKMAVTTFTMHSNIQVCVTLYECCVQEISLW
jgi:hypothetical protein